MSDDLHPKVRDGAYRLLWSRLARLHRLLDQQAPDAIVAHEIALVGKVATMLAPHSVMSHEADRLASKAREAFGVCTEPTCTDDASLNPIHGGLCVGHAALADRASDPDKDPDAAS